MSKFRALVTVRLPKADPLTPVPFSRWAAGAGTGRLAGKLCANSHRALIRVMVEGEHEQQVRDMAEPSPNRSNRRFMNSQGGFLVAFGCIFAPSDLVPI